MSGASADRGKRGRSALPVTDAAPQKADRRSHRAAVRQINPLIVLAQENENRSRVAWVDL